MADKVFAGTVVLPDRLIDNGYVLVGDGKVQAVGSGAAPSGEKHGGAGFFVLPGAIDAQVHSGSQLGQEDFIWSTRSAAAGGVTTIVDMPYDDNCLIANAERFCTKVKEAGAQARVDFALYATVCLRAPVAIEGGSDHAHDGPAGIHHRHSPTVGFDQSISLHRRQHRHFLAEIGVGCDGHWLQTRRMSRSTSP
jgi:hypothetical protein